MTSSMSGYNGPAGSGSFGNSAGSFKDKIPKGYKAGQLQQFTPEQMQLLSQGMQNVGPNSYLSRLAGGDQSLFQEMEAPAYRQFQEQMGDLGSRFSGMGMGARRGSGFNLQGTQAASDFAMQLQSKRQELMRQAQQDLHRMSQDLLGQRPYQRTLTEKPKKWWESLLTSGGNAFAQEAGKSAAKGLFGGGGNPLDFLSEIFGG